MSHQPPPLMYYIGFCPICKTGPLGLRTCGNCRRLAVLCDECDAVWSDYQTTRPRHRGAESLTCPHCEAMLVGGASHWATASELANCDWVRRAVTKGDMAVREGRAFAPEPNREKSVGPVFSEQNASDEGNSSDRLRDGDELLPGC